MDVTIIVLSGATTSETLAVLTQVASCFRKTVTPELESAFSELKQQVDILDELIPD